MTKRGYDFIRIKFVDLIKLPLLLIAINQRSRGNGGSWGNRINFGEILFPPFISNLGIKSLFV